MKKLEKQIRRFPVAFPFDWVYGIAISKLKEDIAELEKLGATHIDIETESNYGDYSIRVEGICERLETDEECEARVAEMQARQEGQKRRELAFLEQLKKKYES